MNLGCSYFFHLLSLLFVVCSYVFAVSLDWATVFVKSCWNYTSRCRLCISWYLFVNCRIFVFQTWIKSFFVLVSALIVLILFLFSSKSHCSFKIVLIKNSVLFFVCYLSLISVFFSCSVLWPVFTRLFRIIIAYTESKNQHHFIPFLSLKADQQISEK